MRDCLRRRNSSRIRRECATIRSASESDARRSRRIRRQLLARYFVEAVSNRDYNLIMGVTLVYGVIVMVFNTLVDIAYALLDPRVELR